MAKPNRLFIYVGLGVVVVAAFVMTEPSKPITNKKKSTKPPATSKAKEMQLAEYTEQDKTATFERVTVGSRDVFKPLVVREGAGGADTAAMPNQVPAGFASGEAGWFYTGTAVVDQVPTALLENTQTGQGLYVKQGDTWKSCKIDRITPTSLTLSSGDKVRTLMLLADLPQSGLAGGSSTQPLNPLSGPVGVQSRPNSVPGTLPNGPTPGAPTGPPTAPPSGSPNPDPQFQFPNLQNEENR
ncbi:MAG: hypothetical protein JSS65_05560 [Armatimonadetes bacterium]|nr:hypothetical protein [Armatimonadota bacterium]